MARILATNEQGITLGVIDKDLQFHQELQSVTYRDAFGAIHTVFAHKSGPFADADAIVQAHQDGTLHPFETHDAAVSYHTQRGDHASAALVQSLADAQPADSGDQGGGN